MAAFQVVTSPKKTGKGDNLWWPESKDEEYKSCRRCNRYLSGQGGGLRAEYCLRGVEKGAGPVVRREHGGGGGPPAWDECHPCVQFRRSHSYQSEVRGEDVATYHQTTVTSESTSPSFGRKFCNGPGKNKCEERACEIVEAQSRKWQDQ